MSRVGDSIEASRCWRRAIELEGIYALPSLSLQGIDVRLASQRGRTVACCHARRAGLSDCGVTNSMKPNRFWNPPRKFAIKLVARVQSLAQRISG